MEWSNYFHPATLSRVQSALISVPPGILRSFTVSREVICPDVLTALNHLGWGLTKPSLYVTIWLHMGTSVTPYKAIADQTRRHILDALREESLTAGAIAQRFPRISRPAVSKHLAILRHSRLVVTERRGREHVYALNAAPLRDLAEWVRRYEVFWDEQMQALKEYVESDSTQEDPDDES